MHLALGFQSSGMTVLVLRSRFGFAGLGSGFSLVRSSECESLEVVGISPSWLFPGSIPGSGALFHTGCGVESRTGAVGFSPPVRFSPPVGFSTLVWSPMNW